jgi:hypothetical protein
MRQGGAETPPMCMNEYMSGAVPCRFDAEPARPDPNRKGKLLWQQKEHINRPKPVAFARTDSVKKWRQNPVARSCPADVPSAANAWQSVQKDKTRNARFIFLQENRE